MIFQHLKLAFRNLPRHKTYTVVSILGLAVAMACCIRVCAFALDEYRRATHHENGDRIFMVSLVERGGRGFSDWTPGGIATAFREEIPEAELVARAWVSRYSRSWVRYEDKAFRHHTSQVEPDFLKMFGIDVIRGTMATEPGTTVVSESVAKKFFGDADPIGKVVTIFSLEEQQEALITGVMPDQSPYSNLKIDFLTTAPAQWTEWQADLWGPKNYVMLPEGVSVVDVETKLNAIFARHVSQDVANRNTLRLLSIHREILYKWRDFGGRSGTLAQLTQIALITLLVVLVACANFVNLTTARFLTRLSELATRKVVGANRRNLIGQIYTETAVVCGFALIVAQGLAVLPIFDAFLVAPVSRGFVVNWGMLFGLLGIWLGVTVVAGGYPAWLVARLRPIEALRKSSFGGQGVMVRRAMVALQGATAVFFVVSALVIQKQMTMIQSQDLGFDQNHLIVSGRIFMDPAFQGKEEVMKAAFRRHPDVVSATTTWAYPFGDLQGKRFYTEKFREKGTRMGIMGADADFVETLKLEIVAGRNLNSEIASDATEGFLINETAAKRLGWDGEAASLAGMIGTEMSFDDRRGRVVGVVKDFHFDSLRGRIRPLVLADWRRLCLMLRIQSDDVATTMAELHTILDGFLAPKPARFNFLDRQIDRHYQQYQQLGSSFQVLAVIAVILVGVGLFGVVSFTIERRQKEVGIRRVLGATVSGITWLFMKENLKVILVSVFVACPVVYYFVNQWLQGFAYRIDLTVSPFLVAGCGALGIVLGVVVAQIARLSRINPADILRDE